MKKKWLFIIITAFLVSANVCAQTATTQTKQQKTQGNNNDSLKQAVTNLKTSFNTLFGGKKDTITIVVANVDYDDSDLNNLKENLKTMKGAKPVSMQYKSGNATIEVAYKGTSTNLWDNLPVDIRRPFKLMEATDNSLSLKFRNPKTTQ
jgi:hypothetical protein